MFHNLLTDAFWIYRLDIIIEAVMGMVEFPGQVFTVYGRKRFIKIKSG
jgi:hypothetical protein